MEILQTKTSISLTNEDLEIITESLISNLTKFGIDCMVKNKNSNINDLIAEHKGKQMSLLEDLINITPNSDFLVSNKDITKYVSEKVHDFMRCMRSREDSTLIDTSDYHWADESMIKGIKLENCTPHDISVFDSDRNGGRRALFLPKCSNPARVHFYNKVDGYLNDMPINNISSLEIKGLPPEKDGVVYVVSFFVLYVLGGRRKDVVAPDSAQLVKDKATGRVIGTRGFVRFKS